MASPSTFWMRTPSRRRCCRCTSSTTRCGERRGALLHGADAATLASTPLPAPRASPLPPAVPILRAPTQHVQLRQGALLHPRGVPDWKSALLLLLRAPGPTARLPPVITARRPTPLPTRAPAVLRIPDPPLGCRRATTAT